VEARYSKENKNCTQEKHKGLKSEIFTLCNICEGNSVYLCVWVIIHYSIYGICFTVDISVYLCYLCCSIFLNRTKLITCGNYYFTLLSLTSGKLYGEKGSLNPGRLENLEWEFKVV